MKKDSFRNLLTNVQIIVRFCFLEKPYWNAFIYHYYNLGVRKIHVIVQLEEDINSINDFLYPKDLNLFIYKLDEKLSPNQAISNFNFPQIKQKDPYTLIIDCDEFLYSFNENFRITDLIGEKTGFNIRWLMNPITTNPSLNSGFLGSSCKQIARTEEILGISNPHKFKFDKKVISAEASSYGLFLIHNWSRSLNDILLKSTFSNIKNIKTRDQPQILENLKKGLLFNRAKYLAFLDIQNRYLTGFNDKYKKHFDKEKELELISYKYSDSLLKIYYEIFEQYKEKLIKSSNLMENYPPYRGNILEQMRRLNSLDIY